MVLKVLIVEDSADRQKILTDLFKDHAWILVSTAERAARLVEHFPFDLISLDYDLAGPRKGDHIARIIADSPNRKAKILIHSMNAPGAKKISRILPHSEFVPISRITKTNAVFKRLRQELKKGPDVNWAFVFGGQGKTS